MRDTITLVLKLFFFFLLLFFTERVIFILFLGSSLKDLQLREIFLSCILGLRMDIATAGILMIPVFLLISIYLFLQRKIILKIIKGYTILLVVITGFINVCDIALYEAWGTRINPKAISYLSYPKEAAASAWSFQYLLAMIVFILFCIVFIRLCKKYFRGEVALNSILLSKISFLLLMPGLIILAARGGVQKFPMDKSFVYFSHHPAINQAGVNGTWNFIHACMDPVELKDNPYKFFSEEEANRLVKEIRKHNSDSTLSILNTNRPNIVLVMLESFSTEIIEPLGGEKGITPNFTELAKEGLLFTDFYTPGFRTEQGLAALVSGFPSQPTTTILRQFGKFDQMPSLARSLDSVGYKSSYYYGGNLHFAYTGSYLRTMGFEKIIGEDDFKFKRRTGWGAYDEELFRYFNEDMKATQQPFFSTIMTSTNHEPFNADVEKIVQSQTGDWCYDYINTVHYTDKCLGELIAGMKQQSWFNNSLIVIVADHAHTCPAKHEYNSAPRHHIPFLLLGGALKDEYKGKTNNHISSQVDFPATILSMLKLKHDQFHWSNDVLNVTSPQSAFYAFDDGFGWINNRQQLVYDHKLKQVIFQKNDSMNTGENDLYIKQGKAYLQMLMDEYIRFNER